MALGIAIANLVQTVALQGAWWVLAPGLGAAFASFIFGWILGSDHVWRLVTPKKGDMVTCIGGPLDGTSVPRPPGPIDALVVHVGGHEGHYRFDEDSFYWEED